MADIPESSIQMLDLSESRLALARGLGADRTLNAAKTDAVEEIAAGRRYEGIDVVFECVGVEKSIRDAMTLVRKGGKIVVCGVFASETTVRMADVQDRELELIGTIMYVRRDISDAIEMLASGRIDGKILLTEEYPLERTQEAFASAFDTDRNVKVVIGVHPE